MNDRDTIAFMFAGVTILCGLVAYLMGKAAGKLDYSDIKKKHEAENQNQG